MNCEQCPAFDHAVRKEEGTCLTASGGLLGLIEYEGRAEPIYMTAEELSADVPELVEEWQRLLTYLRTFIVDLGLVLHGHLHQVVMQQQR